VPPTIGPRSHQILEKISLALSAAHTTFSAATIGGRPLSALMSAVPALSRLVFNIQGFANEVGILL
jgi:hypothetical protein